MFTGIIEEIGTVIRLQRTGDGYDLAIRARTVLADTRLGDSIAVDGVCLTVTHLGTDSFTVGLSPETRVRTNLTRLRAGTAVNLERSLTPSSRLGGHFVQGHIDGTGTIGHLRREADALWLTVTTDPDLLRYVVNKGYIALDGVSLTVVKVEANSFTVQLVAYTQAQVTLPAKKLGDLLNIEVDVLGKYVEKMVRHYTAAPGLTADFLAEHGFDS
ncbi:MAG: riboflavin synthase [Chloroflexota bacterium]|jgi:riboflavin synthase